jgi:hypothetical protein
MFVLEQGMKAERGSKGYNSTPSLTAARDELGRQRHAPATLSPRLYSYQFAVLPYCNRYGLITASKHPHNQPADVSSYIHRAVTMNITALWDMTPFSLVESYFSFSYSYSWYRCACTTVQGLVTQQTAVLIPRWVFLMTKCKCACAVISFVRTRQLYRIESPHPPGHPVNNHRDQGSDKRD